MSRPRGGRFCGTRGRRRVWAALPVLCPAGPAALPSRPQAPSAAFQGVAELLLLLFRRALCSAMCPGRGGRRPPGVLPSRAAERLEGCQAGRGGKPPERGLNRAPREGVRGRL